jgi:hypothetical protein
MGHRTAPQRYVRPLLGAVAWLLLVVGTSQAAWVTLPNELVLRLCPWHYRGDYEFAGNGPRVTANADLLLDGYGRTLEFSVHMHQTETRSDWSSAVLNRSYFLYAPLAGKVIRFVWNARHSEVTYTDTDHAVDIFYPTDTLVKEFRIMGDTSGNDIGNCGLDYAYLTMYLETLWLWVEDVPTGVTEPLALAEQPYAPHSATDVEDAAAGPDRTADNGAAPLGGQVAPVAAPPLPLVAAVHTEIPPAETSHHHDVSPRGSIAANLETQARGDLRRLAGMEDGTNPYLGRVASVFTFLEKHQCAGGACQAAQRVTEAYLRARAALLRDLLDAFLESEGEYEGVREQQALKTLHADFTAELTALVPHVPMLVGLPEVLASTLRVPDYLAIPEDAPSARP